MAIADSETESLGERGLDEACFRLWRTAPHFSARRRLTPAQFVWLAGLIAGVTAFAALAPIEAYLAATAALAILFGVFILLRVFGASAALTPWREPPPLADTDLPRYTIICPLVREARALPQLAESLRALDYPRGRLQIILALEDDDHETIAAAAAIAPDFMRCLTPQGGPRTKPKALNYALQQASGDLIAVYDAEDAPDRRQLRAAASAFARGGDKLGVLQAPILISNRTENWITNQFGAEYAAHFLGVLAGLARVGLPGPLGGTGNHFRREALEAVGGWDPFNVTEDADLGFRLARFGWRMGYIRPPTWETAPTKLGIWVKQRSRWIKGYLQTWFVHMRDPAAAIRQLGPAGFLVMNATLLGGVLAPLLHAPLLGLAIFMAATGHAIPPPAVALMVGGYAAAGLNLIAAAAALGRVGFVRAILTLPSYWPIGFLAALRGVGGFILRPHYWAKTER